jgi:hypothetical protein
VNYAINTLHNFSVFTISSLPSAFDHSLTSPAKALEHVRTLHLSFLKLRYTKRL